MPSPPRLTAADAETLLVSAGFLFLERRGHHRIYGRARTRVVVPFDGRPELHPKIVRMIVESMERSRPTTSFQVDKTIVGSMGGPPKPIDAGAWVTEPGEPTLQSALEAAPDAQPRPAPAAPPKAPQPAPPPPPKAAQRQESETLVIPPTPIGRPASDDDLESDVDLPRKPKPKGVWS